MQNKLQGPLSKGRKNPAPLTRGKKFDSLTKYKEYPGSPFLSFSEILLA